MGVGRASEHGFFWRATYLRRRSIDADRAPPTRRRPVRVRRRRSQRRAERGDRSEGGKCPRRFQEFLLVPSSRHTHSTPRETKRTAWKSPALNPHHPERNSGRSTRKEMSAWSARCSLGVERGGWGCRRDLRNWVAIPPTWRPHTGSARAHLKAGLSSKFSSCSKTTTSSLVIGNPAV